MQKREKKREREKGRDGEKERSAPVKLLVTFVICNIASYRVRVVARANENRVISLKFMHHIPCDRGLSFLSTIPTDEQKSLDAKRVKHVERMELITIKLRNMKYP